MQDNFPEVVGDVHAFFKARGLRLAVAESCTGGLISHMLTSLPGASEFFDTGLVCYSASSKQRFTGIGESVISEFGTISDEAARGMAEGILKAVNTDFALAVTGNLGPSPMEGKDIGLVFIAITNGVRTYSLRMDFKGSRDEIKHQAALAALGELHKAAIEWA